MGGVSTFAHGPETIECVYARLRGEVAVRPSTDSDSLNAHTEVTRHRREKREEMPRRRFVHRRTIDPTTHFDRCARKRRRQRSHR
jgi:hypothetical protein